MYVRLTREGFNTRDIVRDLAGLFGLKEVDVGCAGLKDKQARVTQTFSLSLKGISEQDAARRISEALPVEVHEVRRHTNKLKTGHLLGNAFSILLRDTEPEGPARAQAIAEALLERGLPNFYGDQRFGIEGDNAARGREVLLGRGPKKAWLKRFLTSAFQAGLFNDWLAERLALDLFDRLLKGDVAKKTDTGGLFEVEDEEAEQPRFQSGAITYTGPMYGTKMRRATGRPGQIEDDILSRHEVTGEMLKRGRLEGSRRPARLLLPNLKAVPHEKGLLFEFSLPKGAYATTVLREFTKMPPDGRGEPLEESDQI